MRHFEGIEPVTLACLSAAGIASNFAAHLLQQKAIVLPSNDVVGLSEAISAPETGHLAFMALLLVVLLVLLHAATTKREETTRAVRRSFMVVVSV